MLPKFINNPLKVDWNDSVGKVYEDLSYGGGELNKYDLYVPADSSAGGALALIYAYRDAQDSPIPVKCVIEGVGPASFEPEDWYGLSADDEAAAQFLSLMSGNTITAEMIKNGEYKDAVKDISAYAWVNENSVPTLCAYGVYDKIVPFGSVKYLINALEENNVPHDYIEFPRSGHGLQNGPKQLKLYNKKFNEYLEKYLGE